VAFFCDPNNYSLQLTIRSHYEKFFLKSQEFFSEGKKFFKEERGIADLWGDWETRGDLKIGIAA